MSNAEYLRRLLQPLGVYDFDGTINGAALETKGAALDAMQEILEELERESDLTRAESWGLENWQSLFGLLPASDNVQQSREAIGALLRIGANHATLKTIQNTLCGCGLPVEVEETATGRVTVSFPGVAGIPERFAVLKANIEEILPAHVGITYVFQYITWDKLENRGWTFSDISAMTWEQMEKSI